MITIPEEALMWGDKIDWQSREVETKHLHDEHNQKTHGHRGDTTLDWANMPTQATPSQKRKFAAAIEKRYKTDSDFRAMCDVLSFYTQGVFGEPRRLAAALSSGNPTQWLRDHYKEHHGDESEAEIDKRMKDDLKDSGYFFSSGFGTVINALNADKTVRSFAKKDIDIPADIELNGMNYHDALTGVSGILQAIKNNDIEEPVYRGLSIRAWIASAIVGGNLDKTLRQLTSINYYENQLKEAAKLKEEMSPAKYAKDYSYLEKEGKEGLDQAKNEYAKGMKMFSVFSEGKEFDEALSSYTTDESVATRFSEGHGTGGSANDPRDSTAMIITIRGKKKGIKVSTFSTWKQSEVLTSGRFKVKKITLKKYDGTLMSDEEFRVFKVKMRAGDYRTIPPIYVELEQTGVYDA